MAKIDEILNHVKMLNAKLYGENGFEGDMQEVKSCIKEFRKEFQNQSKRIRKVEIILAAIIGSGVLGGSTIGLINLIGG